MNLEKPFSCYSVGILQTRQLLAQPLVAGRGQQMKYPDSPSPSRQMRLDFQWLRFLLLAAEISGAVLLEASLQLREGVDQFAGLAQALSRSTLVAPLLRFHQICKAIQNSINGIKNWKATMMGKGRGTLPIARSVNLQASIGRGIALDKLLRQACNFLVLFRTGARLSLYL